MDANRGTKSGGKNPVEVSLKRPTPQRQHANGPDMTDAASTGHTSQQLNSTPYENARHVSDGNASAMEAACSTTPNKLECPRGESSAAAAASPLEQQGSYPAHYPPSAPSSGTKSPVVHTGGPSTPVGHPPMSLQHHAHYYAYGAPPPPSYYHHPHTHPPPAKPHPQQQPSNGSTPTKTKLSPSITSPSGSSVAPSPGQSAEKNAVSPYSWHPTAPYHHHPHHAMPPHPQYHLAYGSPENWSKGAASQPPPPPPQAAQHPPPGWPPPHPHVHPSSYAYHPQYPPPPGRYPPPLPPGGRYLWPPQSTLSSLQHRKHPTLVQSRATKLSIVTKLPGSGLKLKSLPSAKAKVDLEAREGATSPTEIETHHRDEVLHMGCTCKKTRCLKLYCQCFAAKIYCGINCRCLLCFNSRKHEKQRKDAMRSILSRNPAAFDTKFKKDQTAAAAAEAALPVPAVAEPVAVPSAVAAADANRVLAHRLGCKCRKSACMKKYCECYAANVKCSSSCRCMGCKNMGGSADFRDNGRGGMGMVSAAAAHAAMQQYHHMPPQHPGAYMGMAHQQQQQQQQQHQLHQAMRNANDPWIAAQSLTFLKRSSPASDRKSMMPSYSLGVSPITKLTAVAENETMPNLTSASDGTSPGDGAHQRRHPPRIMSTPETSIDKAGGDCALLMAAVAMTEFGQSPPPTASMLSPETLGTYNSDTGDDAAGGQSTGGIGAAARASKRSINFDEPEIATKATKKAKAK